LTQKPAQLPPQFRAVTWIALVVSGMISFASLAEAMSVITPATPEQIVEATPPLVDQKLLETLTRAELEAAAAMRGPRSTVLMLLSFIGGLASVSALRLLYPAGLPREGMRRITGGTLLIAGFLRTIDGAMRLVITSRSAEMVRKELQSGAVMSGLEGQPDMIPTVLMGTSVAVTVFMVGALVGGGQYLRSERAKQIVQELDATASGRMPG